MTTTHISVVSVEHWVLVKNGVDGDVVKSVVVRKGRRHEDVVNDGNVVAAFEFVEVSKMVTKQLLKPNPFILSCLVHLRIYYLG